MNILIPIFIFILGTLVGSFLNVVILRYNTGLSISKGRSKCFSCGKELKWHELTPVISFIVLRGRCSKCKSKISWQYPIVEVLTGIMFLLIFLKVGLMGSLLNILFYFAIWSILIVITVYDLRHKIIPNGLVYAFILLSLAQALVLHASWADLLIGPILFLFVWLLWIISKGTWIGLGDAKLMLGMGLLLGFASGISAVLLAFWSGAAVAIFMLLLKHSLLFGGKNITMKSEIPFAPFLILGTALAFFCSIDILNLHSLFGL